MEIKYVTGDLLESDESIIVHGCNAQGVMGSGIALAIREKWPKAYEEYRAAYDANGGHSLGDVIWSQVEDNVAVANAITQQFYGSAGTRYVSYDAISDAFTKINSAVRDSGIVTIGMPLIGADRGGGSWKVISAIIEATSLHYQPVVYLLDGKVPTT